MKKTIYVFEDFGFKNLLPLVYTMPVWEVLCGMRTLFGKIKLLYPGAEVRLLCRDYLAETVRARADAPVNELMKGGGSALFLNGRAVFTDNVPESGTEEAGFNGDTLVYARIAAKKIPGKIRDLFLKNRLPEPFAKLKKKKVKTPVINYFWDIVELMPCQIIEDFKNRDRYNFRGNMPGVHLLKQENIYIGMGAVVKPGVVLDAEKGPIYIGENVIIEPNSVIEGPCAVARGAVIRAAAVIKSSSIGPACRVGGEVSQSVLQSYSNKQHGGYLGNSYVGRWVNIGAGTNNSDLKNNYGSVKVLINGKAVDTGRLHVGVLIADHSKCAISTNLTCGTIVGVCSNVTGKPMAPKYIKSFTWGENGDYDIESAISTARIVMKRRDVTLSQAEEKLLRYVHKRAN